MGRGILQQTTISGLFVFLKKLPDGMGSSYHLLASGRRSGGSYFLVRRCFLTVLLLHGSSAAALPILGSELSSAVSWRGVRSLVSPTAILSPKQRQTRVNILLVYILRKLSHIRVQRECAIQRSRKSLCHGSASSWSTSTSLGIRGKVNGAERDIRCRAATGLPILIHVRHCFWFAWFLSCAIEVVVVV